MIGSFMVRTGEHGSCQNPCTSASTLQERNGQNISTLRDPGDGVRSQLRLPGPAGRLAKGGASFGG